MKGFFREAKRINWLQTFFGSGKRSVITLILFIPILVYAASLGYQYYLQQNPAVVYQHKLQTMTKQVSKTIPLPTDEPPVVATVTDTNILPKELFFKNAKNGDKILMYKKHKLAVLYRPTTGQVITQATLDFRDSLPTPQIQKAVAGASTSAVTTESISVSPTPAQQTSSSNSRTNTYHPQGKVLVVPQQ